MMEAGLLGLYERGGPQEGAEFTFLGLSNGYGGREATRSFRLDAGGSEAFIESLGGRGAGPEAGRGIFEPD